ncbi:MAG: DDE-type integrase/transposase/recombinase [Pseudomonadota bacterium]
MRMCVGFSLSLRNVEDLLFERVIDIYYGTVRFWWNRFGPMFAADIKQRRINRMQGFRHWRWHLDEMFMKINGERHYLWRAVDHESEVLESYVTKKRDKKAAMNTLGNQGRQEIGRWANNRVENSHLPFRRRERVMQRFRRMKSLQKFASVHANVHNHFNSDRHLTDRQTCRTNRSVALAEWQTLMA